MPHIWQLTLSVGSMSNGVPTQNENKNYAIKLMAIIKYRARFKSAVAEFFGVNFSILTTRAITSLYSVAGQEVRNLIFQCLVPEAGLEPARF